MSLPETPLANEFTRTKLQGESQDLFPLYISECQTCHHNQLPVIVNPTRLFSEYVYVSGTSKILRKHFEEFSVELVKQWELKSDSLILEIGSNDGTALRGFKEKGMRVIGVDPAKKIAQEASKAGIPTVPEFFTPEIAQEIMLSHGYASAVIANNVFAHADNLSEMLEGVNSILEKENGLFVFEVQYLPDLLENGYFDMIYHEHLSYHTVEPLIKFLSKHSLNILECKKVSTHGGSIRVVSGYRSATKNQLTALNDFIENERNLLKVENFSSLCRKIEDARKTLKKFFSTRDRPIWGYGAPAKLTTLSYTLEIPKEKIAGIIEDNHYKVNLYTPGQNIRIVSREKFEQETKGEEEEILIFAWNYAESIVESLRKFKHRIYTPFPILTRLH